MDGNFRTPDIRGELDEHLGILGPVIKAEVGQTIMVRLIIFWDFTFSDFIFFSFLDVLYEL